MIRDLPAFRQAVELLTSATSLTLACHVGPDGDALGSMLGLGAAARAAGKKVEASFGEPFDLPRTYRFLPLDLLVPPGEVTEAPELFVTFDAGSADRLGVLASRVATAETVLVIDHHVSNTGFGTVDLIVPDAAATAEIVYHLVSALGWPLDEEAATALYTGIVTDTGRFQYSNTKPETLRVAAALVEAGARPEVVGRHVYEEVPFGYLRVAGAVLGRAVLEPEYRLVWSVLTGDDLAAGGIGLEDTDDLIDLIRIAEESDVAVLVKELDRGRVKVSLRSRGRVDVGAVAVALGGGGHHNAAGFTWEGTARDAIAEVRVRLPRD